MLCTPNKYKNCLLIRKFLHCEKMQYECEIFLLTFNGELSAILTRENGLYYFYTVICKYTHCYCRLGD